VSRELYEGFALQAVDEKGRVAIPADLRASLDRNAETKQILIARHGKHPCLTVRDTEWSKEKHARIDQRQQATLNEGGDIDESEKRRMSMVERAPYDGSGRFVLPPFARKKSQIQNWALFVGTGEEFEIWAPEVILSREGIDPDLRELCEFLCEQRKVAL
jgi:MraZ protein